ncbi:hypothetical protein G7046_g10027 [Stylonectria norvegica]|nr:hypothetical protein G7046_g10027 [Stylonectria norvegica]
MRQGGGPGEDQKRASVEAEVDGLRPGHAHAHCLSGGASAAGDSVVGQEETSRSLQISVTPCRLKPSRRAETETKTETGMDANLTASEHEHSPDPGRQSGRLPEAVPRRAAVEREVAMAAPKMTKNQMRRAKKKEQKKAQVEAPVATAEETAEKAAEDTPEANDDDSVKPEASLEVQKKSNSNSIVPPDGPIDEDDEDEDPAFTMYKEIFSKFGVSLEDEVAKEANAGNTGEVFHNDDDEIPDEDEELSGETKLSKKKLKALNKLSIAELKALVKIPEVVEWQDVSSSDPRLLVQIKAQRNVVPVPTHWSLKREYLSSKRGIEKAPFRLPKFIAETGITEMRDAVLEKQAEQSLKQKQRERVQPKMGKLDIDYQRLYDAFFRFQTKPELTRFGEVYYEGKETEVDYQHFRPGDLTEGTKEALGMPPGAPPPWLINQQRFGPPPSYPTQKIPGLNAPPPQGGSWGFHPGGWGKPPVDEFNRPLYGGDVFGLTAPNGAQAPATAQLPTHAGDSVEKNLWGELQPRDEESEEEEEEEESEDEEDEDVPVLYNPTTAPG